MHIYFIAKLSLSIHQFMYPYPKWRIQYIRQASFAKNSEKIAVPNKIKSIQTFLTTSVWVRNDMFSQSIHDNTFIFKKTNGNPSGHFEVEYIKLTIVLFNRTLREKAELEQMIVDGVSKLKTSITSLHRRLCTDKPQSERTRSTLTLNGVADERKNIDILINKIIQIEESADLLDEKNRRLGL